MTFLGMKTKIIGVVAVLIFGSVFFFAKGTLQSNPPNIEDSLSSLVSRFEARNIQVHLNIPLSNFPTWKDAQASSSPITNREAVRVLSIVIKELDHYPSAVLKKNLEELYLYGDLILYGAKYGGTQLDKRLFLVSGGESLGYTEEYLKETFHHELSSILMRYNPFPKDAWVAVLPQNFIYVQDAESWLEERKIINKGVDENTDHTDLTQGFLNHYGTTSFENDVNTYAEYYFVHRDELQKWANNYPKVAEKLKIFDDFLATLGM